MVNKQSVFDELFKDLRSANSESLNNWVINILKYDRTEPFNFLGSGEPYEKLFGFCNNMENNYDSKGYFLVRKIKDIIVSLMQNYSTMDDFNYESNTYTYDYLSNLLNIIMEFDIKAGYEYVFYVAKSYDFTDKTSSNGDNMLELFLATLTNSYPEKELKSSLEDFYLSIMENKDYSFLCYYMLWNQEPLNGMKYLTTLIEVFSQNDPIDDLKLLESISEYVNNTNSNRNDFINYTNKESFFNEFSKQAKIRFTKLLMNCEYLKYSGQKWSFTNYDTDLSPMYNFYIDNEIVSMTIGSLATKNIVDNTFSILGDMNAKQSGQI